MKTFMFLLRICLYLLLLCSPALASSAAKEVKEGNRLYNQKKYDEAIDKYKAAQAESPDSAIVNFNLGAAMYKKGQFQESIDTFTKALVTEDHKLEAKANYNIGNSKYKLGSQKVNSDLSGAIGLYREALDYYKRAIELNQDDRDAKYNHELVEKQLKVLLDRLKNQQEQQKQEKEKDEGKDEQESKGSQGSRIESKEVKEEEQKQGGTEGKESENKKAEGDAGEKTDDRAEEKETGEMSPEEARMLLDVYGQEEEAKDLHPKGYYPEVLKDW